MQTPSTIPPEQAEGIRNAVDAQSDVYSLGAILYNCITGRPPFHAASSVATLLQVIQQDVVPPKQLNGDIEIDLETICLKCLEKFPIKRYRSAQSLADDLRRYLNGEPIHARSASSFERIRKWQKRNPAIAAMITTSMLALVSLFAVIAVATVAWLWQVQQTMQLSHWNRQLVEQSQLVSTELLSEQNRFESLTRPDSPFGEFSSISDSPISDQDVAKMPDVLAQSRARRAKFWNEFGTFLGSNKNPVTLNQAMSCLTFGLEDVLSLRAKADSQQLRRFHQDVLENRAHFYHLVKEKEKAASDYQQVLEMLIAEATSSPLDRDLQLRIATVHYRMAPDTANPAVHYQKAIEILEPQFLDHPASLNIYFRSCHDLEHITAENAVGIELLENGMRAVELLKPESNRDLWLSWYFDALGRRLNMAGNRTRSVAERRRALALSGQHLSEDPTSVEWSTIDTRVKFNLAISGGVEEVEAIQFFRDITEGYIPIIQMDGKRELDTVHVMAQLNTGIALLGERNPIEAIVYLRRARVLMERSKSSEFLVDTRILEILARSLVDPVSSWNEFESKIDLTKAAGKGLAYFNAARICARAQATISLDIGQQDRTKELMEKAIGFLLAARKSGWDKSLQDQFESESDLLPLKGDPRILSAFQMAP